MKKRCTNQNHHAYARYGGRGISVCDRWSKSYEDFLSDMGARPSRSHSIERIDNDGPYSPDNCRWATTLEQGANKRNNHLITYHDRTQTMAQWARERGIPYQKLAQRLNALHWTIDRALGY